MSEMMVVVTPKGDGRSDGERGAGSGAPPCVTGRVYQIVQMAGLNGEKRVKFIPVPKPLGKFVPLLQSQVTADNAKESTSTSGHNSKGLIANTTTFPSFNNAEHKTATPGKTILPKAPGHLEKAGIYSVLKENPPTPAIPTVHHNYHSDDCLYSQKDAAPHFLDKNNMNYVPLNTKIVPGSVRSPVLPSGHHLQIPANAEVTSVPASLLPPGIQQRILATAGAASNASGVADVSKAPTVIYVSPIKTVKMTASKSLQNVCSKPIKEATEPLVQIVQQPAISSSTINVTSDNENTQMFPIKWIVQEPPQQAMPWLVPVKSSNSMVSKMFKTLIDMNKNNPDSSLLAYSNSLNEIQGKPVSITDNSLLMYNGNVYLLTKKEDNVASANNDDKQVPTNGETQIRKPKSNLISYPADTTLTNQIVSLVLSKNKGITCNAIESETSGKVTPQLQSEESKGSQTASPSLTSPLGSVQISSTSQLEVVSALGQISTGLKMDKSVKRENTDQNLIQNICSSKEASASRIHHTPKEEEEKETTETIFGMSMQIKHRKEQHRKLYLELRRKFGLFKQECVCLRRSEETVCPIREKGLREIVTVKHRLREEEKINEEQEDLNLKRKKETSPILKHAKKKTTWNQDLNSCTEIGKQNSSGGQAESKLENPTSVLQFSESLDHDAKLCVPSNEENINPVPHYCGNEPSLSSEDIFSLSPPDLEETIRDEKITRLKFLLKEHKAALEEFRKKTD